jgi:tRNA(His) 5'-end guanylyltransferase
MTGQGRGRVKRDARGREIYAEIKALPPLIVRADGRHFKSLLRDRERFRKPYDERFAQGMAEATVRFFAQSGFDPRLAYLFSDEINLLFTQVPFNARVEKLDSLIASFLASALTLSLDLHDSPSPSMHGSSPCAAVRMHVSIWHSGRLRRGATISTLMGITGYRLRA